eukprot:5272168-Alexandrium_andersonii.AAC.1
MSASLVGSEMCIRDSGRAQSTSAIDAKLPRLSGCGCGLIADVDADESVCLLAEAPLVMVQTPNDAGPGCQSIG